VLCNAVGAAGEVDCENTPLTSPAPPRFNALTTKEYARPPTNPVIVPVTASLLLPSYPTVLISVPPTPSLRYTMYPLAPFSPTDADGADHSSVMLPVVCASLTTPETWNGLVGDTIAALRSLSPAKLSADTSYV
jgi:hypothetical protein